MTKVLIADLNDAGEIVPHYFDSNFLSTDSANYLHHVYDAQTCGLSMDAVYVFLYTLAVLMACEDDCRELPLWDRQTTYDVAIMLAMSEVKKDAYTPAIERHKYLQTFRAYVAQHHLDDSEWARRVEILSLFVDSAIPNVMDVPNGYVFKAQRCLSDAWKIFTMYLPEPRLEFLSEGVWKSACLRLQMAQEYCATASAKHRMSLIYKRFEELRNNYEGDQHKITLAILQQQKIIAEAQAQIVAIRSGCVHPAKAIISHNWGNSGNYDPHADCYGREDTCTICGNIAHYQTESGKNGYHYKYSTATSLPAKSRG